MIRPLSGSLHCDLDLITRLQFPGIGDAVQLLDLVNGHTVVHLGDIPQGIACFNGMVYVFGIFIRYHSHLFVHHQLLPGVDGGLAEVVPTFEIVDRAAVFFCNKPRFSPLLTV